MIGKLTGRVDHRGRDHVVIDVGGVGYVVHCPDRTLAALPPPGAPVTLHTDLLVREDLLQLFGFATAYEREWHRLLVSVQGVGAKASMAILGALGAEGTARAIALGDAAAIRAAPGIGPKLAQRVVMELKDKAPATMALGGSLGDAMGDIPAAAPVVTEAPPPHRPTSPGAQAEALSALQNLGYAPGDAAVAVARAAATAAASAADGTADGATGGAAETAVDTPALIRAALRLLAPKE